MRIGLSLSHGTMSTAHVAKLTIGLGPARRTYPCFGNVLLSWYLLPTCSFKWLDFYNSPWPVVVKFFYVLVIRHYLCHWSPPGFVQSEILDIYLQIVWKHYRSFRFILKTTLYIDNYCWNKKSTKLYVPAYKFWPF